MSINFVLGWHLTEERATEHAHKHGILPADKDGSEPKHRSRNWFLDTCNDIHLRAGISTCHVRSCYDEHGDDVVIFSIYEQAADSFAQLLPFSKSVLPPKEKLVKLRRLVVGSRPQPEAPKLWWFVHTQNQGWPGDEHGLVPPRPDDNRKRGEETNADEGSTELKGVDEGIVNVEVDQAAPQMQTLEI